MFGRPKLFISYRRADAEASAGHLCTLLRQQFGRDRVFLDTRSIPFGEAFERVIRTQIDAADKVVALIGPTWLEARNERGRRLDQSDDMVRFELATALASGKPVVPVLLNGAAMPRPEQLPEALRMLHGKHAAPMRDASFETDFEPLVDELYGRPRGGLRREVDRLRRVTFALGSAALAVPAAALMVAALAATSALDVLHLDTLGQRWLLQATPPADDASLRLLTIDAASERALGREYKVGSDAANAAAWRRDHARLIDRAAQAGARAVAFDSVMRIATDADAELAAAARRAAGRTPPMRVVFGTDSLAADGTLPWPGTLVGSAVPGVVCLVSRGAGEVWSVPLAVLQADAVSGLASARQVIAAGRPALALAALANGLRAVDRDRGALDFAGALPDTPLRFSALRRHRGSSDDCPALPANSHYAALLLRISPAGHWRDPVRHLSYADALDPARVADAALAGRVLLVGNTELGSPDRRSDTHAVSDGVWSSRRVYGVELHADAYSALASGRVPRLPNTDRQALTAFAASLVGALAATALYTQHALWRRTLLLTVVATWIALAWWLAHGGIILNVGYDLLALLLAYIATRAAQQLASWRQSRGGIDP